MHFWIDKRSSQLHQYGGNGRRGAGAGGFYSQNFGTHRNAHHPPPSLGHHHPHRLRTRSSSTSNASTSLSNVTTNTTSGSNNNTTTSSNNNIAHSIPLPSSMNNNHASSSSAAIINPTSSIMSNGNSPSVTTIALQYPHQHPHQVQGHTSAANLIGPAGSGGFNLPSTITSGMRNSAGRNQLDGVQSNGRGNSNTSFFPHHHLSTQPQSVLGGGIMAISGSTNNGAGPLINATTLNPPMAIVAGDDGEGTMTSTTVLTFPPTTTSSSGTANPNNSINVQLISCVNINRENNRGGIDLSWRNPYHVPGSSISRCRAYSRDGPPPSLVGSSSGPSSRGTRGRRSSNSSSTGPARGSIPGTAGISSSTFSQNANSEVSEGMTERSVRSEHNTSFDRDTVTPQMSLTSPDAAEQSSRGTSTGGRPSLEQDPGWACTKRVGLTLCFLAFILLGTVGAKFMIQGPGVIDTSRTGKAEAAAYFLFTELIFVAFAMALFFLGVACLRKRTNDYLLRQFNQYILNTSATAGATAVGGIPRQDAYDFVYYDGEHPQGGGSGGSPLSRSHHHHHLHHNLHHGGFHHYRHHRSNGSLMEDGDFGSGGDLTQSPSSFNGAGPIHYPAHYGNSSSNSRHGSSRSKPPPYHIALYLPLPEGMGSPTTDHQNSGSNAEQHGTTNKGNRKGDGTTTDGIGFIDSSSNKDLPDASSTSNNVSLSNNALNENRDSQENGEDPDNRSETPPPPYEQL